MTLAAKVINLCLLVNECRVYVNIPFELFTSYLGPHIKAFSALNNSEGLHPALEFSEPVGAVHARLVDPAHPQEVLWDAVFAGKNQSSITANDQPISGLKPYWPSVSHRGNFQVQLTFVPSDQLSSQGPIRTHAEFFADAKTTPLPETMSWFPKLPATPDAIDVVPFRPADLLPINLQ